MHNAHSAASIIFVVALVMICFVIPSIAFVVHVLRNSCECGEFYAEYCRCDHAD